MRGKIIECASHGYIGEACCLEIALLPRIFWVIVQNRGKEVSLFCLYSSHVSSHCLLLAVLGRNHGKEKEKKNSRWWIWQQQIDYRKNICKKVLVRLCAWQKLAKGQNLNSGAVCAVSHIRQKLRNELNRKCVFKISAPTLALNSSIIEHKLGLDRLHEYQQKACKDADWLYLHLFQVESRKSWFRPSFFAGLFKEFAPIWIMMKRGRHDDKL